MTSRPVSALDHPAEDTVGRPCGGAVTVGGDGSGTASAFLSNRRLIGRWPPGVVNGQARLRATPAIIHQIEPQLRQSRTTWDSRTRCFWGPRRVVASPLPDGGVSRILQNSLSYVTICNTSSCFAHVTSRRAFHPRSSHSARKQMCRHHSGERSGTHSYQESHDPFATIRRRRSTRNCWST